jgi:hypothetical protein
MEPVSLTKVMEGESLLGVVALVILIQIFIQSSPMLLLDVSCEQDNGSQTMCAR